MTVSSLYLQALQLECLLALRRICQDPSIKVITLPLISRFYGPSGYPSLEQFPGCTVPNDRQAFQAPGLLNCSALGAEVQRCQASGRKVLLSIKADGLEAVGGNSNFGDPNFDPNPFGPVYVDGGPAGATYDNIGNDEADDDLEKRQVEVNISFNFPGSDNGLHRLNGPTSTKSKHPHRPDNTNRPAPPPRPDETGQPPRPHRPSFSDVPFPTLPATGLTSKSMATPAVSVNFPVFETTIPVVIAPASDLSSSTLASEDSTPSPATLISESEIFIPAPADSTADPTSATPISEFAVFIPITAAFTVDLSAAPLESESAIVTPVSADSTPEPNSATLISDSAIFTRISETSAPDPSSIFPGPSSIFPDPSSIFPDPSSIFPDPSSIFPDPSSIFSAIPEPTPFPNLFSESHPATALALTLFSLFGEGHTERADLRPLGPDVGGPAAPSVFNGTNWVTPSTSIVPLLERPLGEEVVIDGFDVQVPVEWKGRYQDTKFRNFVARLRELNRDAWKQSGGIEGGPGDLGADGKAVVYFGWVGEFLKRSEAGVSKVGWIEWDGSS
ncbi:hypothetical protein J1614_009562 [Plenodomus biglobosus]|nr:hypothetical protein J1614_009562 [Plenodomus biglobosus]